MCDKLSKLKTVAEKEFPGFTGRIILDMYNGEVGSTEKTERERYPLLKKPFVSMEFSLNKVTS